MTTPVRPTIPTDGYFVPLRATVTPGPATAPLGAGGAPWTSNTLVIEQL